MWNVNREWAMGARTFILEFVFSVQYTVHTSYIENAGREEISSVELAFIIAGAPDTSLSLI